MTGPGTVVRNASQLAATSSPQRQQLTHVITRPEVDTDGLCGLAVTMPGRHHAAPHEHAKSELIVHVLQGAVTTLWGEDMHHLPHTSGDMVYIPAGVPHAGASPDDLGCVLTEVRTDPWGNLDVQMRPDLDARASLSTPAPSAPEPQENRPVVASTLDARQPVSRVQPEYQITISSRTAPVQALSAGHLELPPAGRLDGVWVHQHTERLVYCVSGSLAVLCGMELRPRVLEPGTFFWSTPEVPYTVVNLSDSEPAVATEYRTDPRFDADVLRIAGLDELTERRADRLRELTGLAATPVSLPVQRTA